MGFSEILRDLRKEKQLTQRELAKYLGLTANCICEWENKRSEPSMVSILKMCSLFEVSADYLLGRSEDFGNIGIVSKNSHNSGTEEKLLRYFRKLSPSLQDAAIETVRVLAGAASENGLQKKA